MTDKYSMKIQTDQSHLHFQDYTQLSHESGITVVEEYNMDTNSITNKEIKGKILAVSHFE